MQRVRPTPAKTAAPPGEGVPDSPDQQAAEKPADQLEGAAKPRGRLLEMAALPRIELPADPEDGSHGDPFGALVQAFPDHGKLHDPKHEWLAEFKKAQPQTFDRLFYGKSDLHHYSLHPEVAAKHNIVPQPADARAALGFKDQWFEKAIKGKGFSPGALGSFMGDLAPWLAPVGHHYDDLVRVVKHAMGGPREVRYSDLEESSKRTEVVEASTGLHLHAGKPMKEVGVVLALCLGIGYLTDSVGGKKLPWIARTLLKAAGTYPLYKHIIHGELSHALEHAKEGELEGAVHQVLIAGLSLVGIFKKTGGVHELAAGTSMAAILASVGHMQTNAVERSFEALRKTKDTLPKTVNQVEGEARTQLNVNELKPGETIFELKEGDTVPVDATIVKIEGDATLARFNTNLSRGQVELQPRGVGDKLDQGSILRDKVTIHARVDSPFEKSCISRLVESQENYKPSKRQSFAQKVGNGWVWGTIGGTILVALGHLISPLLNKKKVSIGNVLERAACFATLSAPCSVLISPMIEGSTTRRLAKQNVVPIQGDAITIAEKIDIWAMDFSGTCSVGAEFVDMAFYRPDGTKVPDEEAWKMFAEATAVELKANSQHLKVKGMKNALRNKLKLEEAQRIEAQLSEATEDRGNGVRGTLDGKTIRVGAPNYVIDASCTEEQQAALREFGDKSYTNAHVRVGDCFGVVRFTDHLRPGAKEAVAAMGPNNVYILTGYDNRDYILEQTRQLGIPPEHVFTDLKPEQKPLKIKELQQNGQKKVGAVGDGLNDAELMHAADVSFAMADTANDSILTAVDFVVPDLPSVAPIKKISQQVNRTSKWTLGFSVFYTGLAAISEATGWFHGGVATAAALHEGATFAIAGLHDWLSKRFEKTFVEERDRLRGTNTTQTQAQTQALEPAA